MRLNRYIKEISDTTTIKAKEIIVSNLPQLYNILKKKSFNITTKVLVNILNNLFKRYKIVFILSKSKKKRYKYITQGMMYVDGKIEIEIDNNQQVGKFFRRFAREDKKDDFFDVNKNGFLRDLLSTLSHEILHQDQLSKAGEENWKESGKSEIDYLSDPQELEAQAQDSAIEILRTGTSYTLQRYFSHFTMKSPVLRIFLKKVTYYCRKIKF